MSSGRATVVDGDLNGEGLGLGRRRAATLPNRLVAGTAGGVRMGCIVVVGLLVLFAPVTVRAAQANGAAADLRAGALTLAWGSGGRITRVECGGDDITGADTAASGFALRDWGRQADCVPLAGKVARAGRAVRFDGQDPDGVLAVSSEFVPDLDWVVVRGEIRNLSGQDRAVTVQFALPVNCEGWHWGEQLHKTRALFAGLPAHLGIPTTLGSGHMALRPVAALADATHSLGLAVPVDRIGLYDFSADAGRGLFTVTFDIAMTRHCPGFFEHAPFEFYIVAEADGWGLRSVLARYYANRPEFFRQHTSAAGGWFAWGDILRQPPPISDYGLMFHEHPESAEGYAHDQALGIRVYPYIEPFMYQMCLGDHPGDARPSREQVLERVTQWARPETTDRLTSVGWRSQEELQRICKALQRYGPRDARGDPIIGAVGQWPWISGSKWAAQFPLDLTPGVPDGAGQDRLAHVRAELLTQPFLNGIYLDSVANHLERVYFPDEALRYLTYAPPFDRESLKPASLIGFAAWEWIEALWSMLPEPKRELLPNLYYQRVPLPWHRLTVMGKEHWCDPTGALMQQYRAMGYRKVVTQLPAYEDRDERFLRNLMLLDVFPGGYARRPTDPPGGMRQAYRSVIPRLRQLHRLGWEPVPHAKAVSSGAWIERYGRTPGPICFAVYNPCEAGIVRLDVDARALALTGDAYVVDVMDGSDVEYSTDGVRLFAAIALPGNSTTLLMVADRRAHSQWLSLMADDRLDDARVCLREYALRRQMDAHPAWPTIERLASGAGYAAIESAAQALRGDTSEEVRARELLELAGTAAREASSPMATTSRPPVPPIDDVPLPWREDFETLSPTRWHPESVKGIGARNNRLELELPVDATMAEICTLQSWPFVPHPLVINADFKFAHGEHDRYLRQSMKISGTPGGEEYLLIRIESTSHRSALIRVENHNAPPTNWAHTLTEWVSFDPGKPHHVAIRLDKDTFALELDGTRIGSGPHECGFNWAVLALGVYSGHRGHGDVCWWDELTLRRAP